MHFYSIVKFRNKCIHLSTLVLISMCLIVYIYSLESQIYNKINVQSSEKPSKYCLAFDFSQSANVPQLPQIYNNRKSSAQRL